MRSNSTGPALALAIALTACGGSGTSGSTTPQLTVLTWNVLHGGAFSELASGGTGDLGARFDALWAGVEASAPETRMRAVARAIAAAHPDLVGLQEAARWRAEPRASAPVEHDLLARVLAELAALGADYTAVATASGVDVTLPGSSGTLYRFTDRDVVLARAGLAASNPRTGTYVAVVGIPGTDAADRRAWASVDVDLGGRQVRFVSTHLATVKAVAAAQAAELVDAIGTSLPVVLVGDLNSAPGDPAYDLLLSTTAGFRDVWSGPDAPPPTCCRSDLRDPAATLGTRYDHVLHRGATAARSAARVGAEASSMLDGVWPSDHAGVAATIDLH
jgi:endonuclease/exonuclease/phosphatase family metal-dependent hydrolase